MSSSLYSSLGEPAGGAQVEPFDCSTRRLDQQLCRRPVTGLELEVHLLHDVEALALLGGDRDELTGELAHPRRRDAVPEDLAVHRVAESDRGGDSGARVPDQSAALEQGQGVGTRNLLEHVDLEGLAERQQLERRARASASRSARRCSTTSASRVEGARAPTWVQ